MTNQPNQDRQGGDGLPSPYSGPITIDTSLLHALWCYGNLRPVTGVVYSYGTHQTALDEADRLIHARATPQRTPGAAAACSAVSKILCGEETCTDAGDWRCPQDIETADEMIVEIVDTVLSLATQPTRDGAEGADCEQCSGSGRDTSRFNHDHLACPACRGTGKAAPPKPAPDAMRVLMDEVRTIRATCGFLNESEATRLGAIAERCDDILSAPVPPADGALSEMREAIKRLAETHVGAWLQQDDARLQIVPTAARQDIRDFADAVLALVSSAPVPATALEEAMWLLHDVPGETLSERISCLTKWYLDLKVEEVAEPVAWRWKYQTSPPNATWTASSIPLTGDITGLIVEPLYAAPPVRGDREAIARIIDPDLFEKYDIEFTSGRCAQNGRNWAEVCYGEKIAAVRAKADAILSLPVPPGAGEREAAIEECAEIVDAEYGRILSKQTLTTAGDLVMQNSVNANLRMIACFLPEISTAIRALSRQAPHSSSEGGR